MILDDITEFIAFIQLEKRYSKHTGIAYETDLISFKDFIDTQFDIHDVEGVTYQMVRSWLASLKADDNKSKTINRKVSSLKSFYKYLLKNNRVVASPMAKIIAPKNEKRLPVFINENDMDGLLDVNISSSNDWALYNEMIMVRLFYATGMRLSELIALKTTNIDFERKCIKVLGKGNKERIIPINAQIMQLISEYHLQKKKYFEHLPNEFFVTEKGKKLYPKYVYLKVKHSLTSIKNLEKKSPHVLRHSFATHLMNNGAELNAVKDLLGHSSLAATQVYTHNTIEKLKQEFQKAHPKA